jgi:hypothetical protein
MQNIRPARPSQARAAAALLLALAAGTLLACAPQPSELPAPKREVAEGFPGTSGAPFGDTSVPSAQTALFPGPDTAAAPATGVRDDSGLSKAEESRSMPQAGQANAHSAPKAEAGASAP